MLFFDIFGSFFRVSLYLSAYVALFYIVWRIKNLKTGFAPLWLAVALAFIFITSVLQNFSNLFERQFVSIKILTLAEMILILASSAFLIASASNLILKKSIGATGIFSFVSIGLLLAVYGIFITGDANILINIRQLLPIIGMSCVFFGFLSQPRAFKTPSMLIAALTCLGFIGLMIWPMIQQHSYPWYAPLLLIILYIIAFIMLIVKNLQEKLSQALEKQQRTAQNIQNIVRSSPFPIIISRLTDDQLVLVNRNALKLFGLNENELGRYHFKDFFVDADNRRLLMERLEKKQEIQDFEILVKSATTNTPFWLLLSANAMDYNNDVVLYAAFQDITDRKRRETILKTQADRDPLTSIYNRRYFEDHSAEKIMLARRSKQPFAILMLDADHFKKINDTYGHKIGDKVLIELAAVCERTLRPNDLVARYGGEEFIIFLENVEADIALLVANRLRETISNSVVYTESNEPIRFTVSIGVAPSGISDHINTMIKMADDAMYLAKENGRNRVEMYDLKKIEQAKQSQIRKQDEKSQRHPVYLAEDDQEISLLDGIESKHIIED